MVLQDGNISAPASTNQSSDEEEKEPSNKLIEGDIVNDGTEIKPKKHKKSKKKSKHTDEERHYNVCDNNSDDDKHGKKSKKKKHKKKSEKSEIENTDDPVEIDNTNKISELGQKDGNVGDIEEMPAMDESKRKKKKKNKNKDKTQSHDTASEVPESDNGHDTTQTKATKRKRMQQAEVLQEEEDETTLDRKGSPLCSNEKTTSTDLNEPVPRKKRKELNDAVNCSNNLEKSKMPENCKTNRQISETKTKPKKSKQKKAYREGGRKFSKNPSKFFKGSNLGNVPGYGR